jgi:putative solute:sodium symporter small subunit
MADVTRAGEAGGGQPPPEDDGPPPDNGWRKEYWRRNLRLMVILLSIWFIVSFGCGILFVEQLNTIVINGFPLGFWFAQQGSIYTFVALILVYAVLMDRLDDQFGVSERDGEGRRM